uniref:HAT C-terminal dimerisation domain-containing protein n=1 Tax=Oryza brachyantha TaxID=4533 RepID=J3MBM8_ORYBR
MEMQLMNELALARPDVVGKWDDMVKGMTQHDGALQRPLISGGYPELNGPVVGNVSVAQLAGQLCQDAVRVVQLLHARRAREAGELLGVHVEAQHTRGGAAPVNLISKQLQSKDMPIDVAIESVQGLISFFKNYRETGFAQAQEAAKEIAIEMEINPEFRTKRKIKRKWKFDEATDDASSSSQSAEDLFRTDYFIPIVDQAIASLIRRFEQYQGYEKIFGFLFTSDRLRSLDNKSLMVACVNLENKLQSGEHKDIDGKELYGELIFIQDLLNESMSTLDILRFLKKHPFYPNAIIAYRILLTIPVTIASAERSFSKLKLLKSYLRSTVTRERLNGLAIIALENDVFEKINYEHIIEDFISRNTRRMMLFNRN